MNLPENFIENATRHFNHAVKKHPYFIDRLSQYNASECEKSRLEAIRFYMVDEAKKNDLSIETVLSCEVAEAMCADTKEEQREEIYDAIAVLMRWLCVVEGTQVLGDACVNDPSRKCVDCEMPCTKKNNTMFEQEGAK